MPRGQTPGHVPSSEWWWSSSPLAGSRSPVVDQSPCDREWRRDKGEIIRRVPARVEDLLLLDVDLPARVLGREADHQRVWEGPRLAPEVADVADFDPRLLAHLAHDCLL